MEQRIAAECLVEGQNQTSSSATKRVGLSVIEPFVIDTRHTLGNKLFGKPISKLMWAAIKGPMGLAFGVMYVGGLVTSATALFGFLPYVYSYSIFAALPTWILFIATLNLELLKQLLFDFECILLLLYTFSIVMGFSLSFSDERLFICGVGQVGIYFIILVDAAPEGIRKVSGL